MFPSASKALFALPFALAMGGACARKEATPATSMAASSATSDEAHPMRTKDAAASSEVDGASRDAVDAVVRELSNVPFPTGGLAPTIDLPATASVEEVLKAMFAIVSFTPGRVTRHSVLGSRRVSIPTADPHEFLAVTVDTNLGQKIVLMQHQGPRVGWWTRAYPGSAPAP